MVKFMMEFEVTPDNHTAAAAVAASANGGGNSESDSAAPPKKKSPPSALIIDSKLPGISPAASGRSTGDNTPTNYDSTKIPFKPALKSASSMDSYDSDENSGSENDNDGGTSAFNNFKKKKKSKKTGRTLKWDEAKIQEHDQLRGTRMKIEEPNTPFAASYYDSGSETDCSMNSRRSNRSVSSAQGNNNSNSKISWDALTNKLEAHAAVAASLYPPSSPSSHGGGTRSDKSDYCTTDEEDADQKRERQRQEMRRLEFQQHRKQHYNEMEVVRRFRRDHPGGEPTSNGNHSSTNSSVSNFGDDDSDDDENE